MNTTFKKSIIVLEFVLIVVGIAVANSTLIPLIISGMLFYPVHKAACSMTDTELMDAFGLNFLKNKFKNSEFISVFTNVNE